MKRSIFVLSVFLWIFMLSPNSMKGQSKLFDYNICVNGYWGNWKNSYLGIGIEKFYINGKSDNFIIHSSLLHPSNYIMKVVINNFVLDTDKKSKKERMKSNTWYEYSGTVEYYTELTFQNFGEFTEYWPYSYWNTSNGKKHVVKAKIKIAPYEDYPQLYNIFFENYGVAISRK